MKVVFFKFQMIQIAFKKRRKVRYADKGNGFERYLA